MSDQMKNLDWSNLGFSYVKTDYRYISYWENGAWDNGALTEDPYLSIEESATSLHYGQQCFEGLKAYRTKTNGIQLFRPDCNAKRMQESCRRLLMPEVPENQFIDACCRVVKANDSYVPPYGSGASFYIRPFVAGAGDNLGLKTAPKFIFRVFGCPVGPYFKSGLKPIRLCISEYDRAAPYGTGAVKVGGNYAAGLYPHELAVHNGYDDCIYLDPATHTKIEEVGAANFYGITEDNKFITPKSPSILGSITKYSLLTIAKDYLEMEVEERDIPIDSIGEFKEAGACGTAAVITPIGSIKYKDRLHVFHSEQEVGPVTKKLYDLLSGMQIGDVQAPSGWIYNVQ